MIGVRVGRIPPTRQLFEKNAQLLTHKRNLKIPRMKAQSDHRLETPSLFPDRVPESG
jgi:hypothetical protein